MADRYYSNQKIRNDLAVLDGQEAQHLAKVMRAKPGDRVTLFDGSGDQFEAEVDQVQRQKITLKILSRDTISRELPVCVTLYVPLPKGDRERWLVEKAVELGATRLVPLVTARSVVKPNEKSIERLERAVIEASKQCGRNRLMEIAPPQTWTEVLAKTVTDKTACRLIAHPLPQSTAGNVPFDEACNACSSISLAVGPEGGFTDDEVDQALHAGWQPVDLGSRILRIETAALALLARVAQNIT